MLHYNNAKGYGGFDTTKVLYNAKLSILDFGGEVKDIEDVLFFLKDSTQFEFIQSSGFEDYIFFRIFLPDGAMGEKVKIKIDASKDGKTITSYRHKSLGNYKSTYTFAYYTQGSFLYKLDGNSINDYFFFYSFLTENHSLDTPLNIFKSKKKFAETFSIEGIDMECLYRTAKAREKELKKKAWYGDCSAGK